MPEVGYERVEPGLRRGQDALGHALGVNARGGDRVAQLVRDVGDEAPAQLLGLLERVGHPVERVAERRDLGRARRLDAMREVARRRGPRRPISSVRIGRLR